MRRAVSWMRSGRSGFGYRLLINHAHCYVADELMLRVVRKEHSCVLQRGSDRLLRRRTHFAL